MSAVTILSDFGSQENKVCQCYHFVLIYLQRSDASIGHELSFLNLEF